MTQMDRIINTFDNLNANNIKLLDSFYAKKIHFQDPLGTHQGIELVKAYYSSLYNNVTSIKFEYTQKISQGNKHVLVWTMHLRAKKLKSGKLVRIDGSSIIHFNEEDQVTYHRDYFDMGEFIYEHIPILGWLIRIVKNKLKS